MRTAVVSYLPLPRGRGSKSVTPAWTRMFPTWERGKCFVYLVFVGDDVLKVGITDRPRERLRQHWKNAGGDVRWVHLFAPCSRAAARSCELMAPEALELLAARINRSEWYQTNASKQDLVRAMRSAFCEAVAKQREIDREQDELRLVHARIRGALDAAGLHDIGGHIYVPSHREDEE